MHGRYLFISTIFVVALAAHVFVASWFIDAVPALRPHRRKILALVVGLCALTAVCRFTTLAWHSDVMVELVAAGLIEWMIVIFGAIPLGISRLFVRLLHGLRSPSGDEGARGDAEALTRRQAVERVAGTLALGASTAVLGWGCVRGRHAFEIDEVPVRISGLPRALDGYTIGQISDLHAGVFVGDRELDEGLSRLREVRADLVVVTGDLVDFDARYAPMLAGKLGGIVARDGVFAIFGNHDYYAGPTAIATALRDAGIELLVNDGRIIRPGDGGGFALLGVDDLWAARWNGPGPSLDRAIARVRPDLPRILLAHQPSYFDMVAGKVALQLSGHTHGGQVNPGFRPGEWFLHYVAGRYERKGSTLWVNRGFGVAGPPTRVGAPPEVTKIVLVAA
jgi:predicted MPP superfamily phosphohydrolase